MSIVEVSMHVVYFFLFYFRKKKVAGKSGGPSKFAEFKKKQAAKNKVSVTALRWHFILFLIIVCLLLVIAVFAVFIFSSVFFCTF